MTTMAGPRKTISIHDYPEHLNPFREDDNHSKIRFWTIGRKLNRSNSITFSGLKDLRNSWSLRYFMRKGKKNEQAPVNKHTNQGDGDSPIMFRRSMQYSSISGARSTVGSPERADRYVYGGSVTPLPRSRFQERLRSSQHEVNSLSATPRMARSEITGSRLSVASTNPFDEAPVPPVRASRRKKKRAPAPPSTSLADESVTSDNLDLTVSEVGDVSETNTAVDDEIDNVNLKVELKIVEDEDQKTKELSQDNTEVSITEVETITISSESDETKEKTEISEEDDSHDEVVELRHPEVEIVSEVPFPKVDISKYRRNSSVNEDEIRLRRDNLDDFQPLNDKRSKSLTNNLSGETYITYDINLNENKSFDINSNEEPHKVVCKIYEESRKSVDNSISSTEKEFLEIDKATRELEREISKLNSALIEDDFTDCSRLSVSEIRQKFDRNDVNSPNPIPKPRRSNHAESNLTINGKL